MGGEINMLRTGYKEIFAPVIFWSLLPLLSMVESRTVSNDLSSNTVVFGKIQTGQNNLQVYKGEKNTLGKNNPL